MRDAAPKLKLRPATQDDEAFLVSMLAYASGWRDGKPAPAAEALASRYARGFGRAGDLGVVAESDGERAGAAWCRLLRDGDRGYGPVADDVPELALAVLPEQRGVGLGTMLVDALLDAVARSGFRAVSLSVQPDNPAVRIYERAGFERCGTVQGSWTMRVDIT